MFSKMFGTVKYTLITVNFLFLLTGIIVLGVGSSVQSAYDAYHPFLTERFFSLPAFCIATGVIIFLIAFFGFFGAFMENYYMIMAFVGAMFLVFVFQLSACIAGYVLKDNAIAVLQKQLLSTMDVYGAEKNFEVTKLWDEVQADFECCGVHDVNDWVAKLPENTGIPVSCCEHVFGTVAQFNCNATISFKTGCGQAFGEYVKNHAASIGVAGVFLVIMQGLTVAGALWLAKITRAQNSYP